MWKGVKLTRSNLVGIHRRSFEPDDPDVIEHNFHMIMMCSNIVGRIQVVDSVLVTSTCTGVVVLDVALS